MNVFMCLLGQVFCMHNLSKLRLCSPPLKSPQWVSLINKQIIAIQVKRTIKARYSGGYMSREEDVYFLMESKKASVRRKCFSWASRIKRKFPSEERVEWNTILMELQTQKQQAVKNYSVFKDCKRPLVEYDSGIKLTSHWSLQNIRVSSKNIFESSSGGCVCIRHYAKCCLHQVKQDGIVHPVNILSVLQDSDEGCSLL